MRGKHESFCLAGDRIGLFTRGSQAGRIAVLAIKGNDLIDPLTAYLMILSKIRNGIPSFPLTNDTTDIPVGEFTPSAYMSDVK